MPRIETVKIKDDSHPCGYVVINKCDMKDDDKLYQGEQKKTRRRPVKAIRKD